MGTEGGEDTQDDRLKHWVRLCWSGWDDELQTEGEKKQINQITQEMTKTCSP